MKRIVYCLLLIIGVCFPTYVFAQEYEVKELIPVDTVATVSTDKLTYYDFSYNSTVDSNGNAKVNFNSIQNNTMSKIPVTINLLLFDGNQKNIGIVTYCSNKDISSNYAGFQLAGNQSSPFSINVVSKKYFVEGKTASDVKYISVLDENKYCHVGGYDKYAGLTISEISKGDISEVNKENNLDYSGLIKGSLLVLFIRIGVIIISLVVSGMILNALNKRMYAKTTIWAYIPITNAFVTIKLAFGKIAATIFIVIYLIASGLYAVGVNFLLYLVIFIESVAFIIVIIKLITKKYDLLILEPSIKTNIPQVSDVSDGDFSNYNVNDNSGVSNDSYIASDDGEAIDLSYDDVSDDSEDIFNISKGNFNSTDIDKPEENTNERKDDEEKSDLSKFFQ